MSNKDKTLEELLKDLHDLQQENNSLKESYEKDINLLRQAEEKLKRSEEIFRKAYMVSPDSININRLSDGMYISINEGFTRILGYSEVEAVGKTSTELNIWVNPDDRANLVKELETKREVKNFEAGFLTKEGMQVYGLMSATLIDFKGVPHIISVTRDITKRKKNEEELVKEQNLMDIIMNNLPDHIYFKDRESRFIRITMDHARSFGLSDPSQAAGKTDFDFFTMEHARQAFEDEQRVMETGQPLSKEEKLTWTDRPDTWSSTTKLPMRDIEGNIIGTFGISRDITQAKKTEDALEKEHNLLRTLIDNMPDRIYAKDIKGRFIICNEALVKRMGKSSQSEIIGKSDFDFISHDLAEQYYNNEQKIISTHEPLINHEESMGNIAGIQRWNLTTKVPLCDKDNNVIGIVGMGRDITNRKRKEQENQVLLEINQGITTSNHLDDLLKLIHHSLMKVVYAENFFVALFNQKTGLFNFPYFVDKIDPEPEPLAMAKSCTAYVYRTAKPLLLTQEKFNQLADQKEVELVGSNSPSWIGIPLNTPSSIIGVLVLQHYETENVYSESDVNFLTSIGSQIAISIDRKRTEEEIKLKNELLQQINAEKDKFFSIIAHDLRGPLSAFVDATQIITEDIQNMTIDEIRDITMSMKNDASNIYKLLENLLEWSRLQRGVMEFNPQKLKLNSIIGKGVASVNASAKTKSIDIYVTDPGELEITADEHMFETVIRNLVSNAVKFTPVGGKVTVTAAMTSGNLVEIRITDTGIGMTSELIAKLFSMTEWTNRPGTAGEPSSGLGLLLCKEFIEKHGGKIWVESEEGKGSTFHFTIPDKILYSAKFLMPDAWCLMPNALL